jgi:hypothetical protein
MANFKPQVTYMTSESLHDYRVERYGVISPYKTERFNTYTQLKKALKDRILHEHIGEDEVFVTRSRRGEWGEWFEKWVLINKNPTIIKKGWQ